LKVKPYYFTKSEDGYSQDKIKQFKITKNITLKKEDKDYLFDVCNYKIKKTSFKGTELIFDIQYDKVLSCGEIESYITDAWHKFCNSGDPIKANFIKEKKYNKKQIYFATEDITFEYPKLS
tara:strand:- start:322 stop:684 length:363 start_codon:yes stop_codon:yes gene_type:complete